MTAKLILNARATLAEGPVWDHRRQQLIWVDIEQSQIHRYDPATKEDTVYQLDKMVGAAVPTQTEHQLLLALADGIALFDSGTQRLSYVDTTERDVPGNRFNDGKCDPAGRFWAGTMSLRQTPVAGALYCLFTDHSVHKKIDNVTISNGLAWTADAQTMYFVDSPTQQVMAYDYDPATGDIGNPRVVIRIPPKLGTPDGMTIDREDKLWIALWGGFGVGRWDPLSGELMEMVRVNAPQVTSCTFGGAELDELFITTARSGMSEEQLDKYPESGGLFNVRPGIAGRPVDLFKAD